LYRTTVTLENVAAKRLVYFHNHGEPGPGVYLPASWSQNRATFHERGTTLSDLSYASTLVALPPEGLYSVREAFHCCDKQCVRYEPGALVQLGYDAQATAILFTPEWSTRGLTFPDRGTRLDETRIAFLTALKVTQAADSPRDPFLH
jgi:hypothetical protein